MVYELIRFSVDLLAPGAEISKRLADYYCKWDRFHSLRIMYPVKPMTLLLDIRADGARALADCAHVRVTPIGEEHVGFSNGVADFILIDTRLDFFLGNELPRVISKSLLSARPYKYGKTSASFTEIFSVDENTQTGKFFADFSFLMLKQLAEQQNKDTTPK